MPNPIINRIWSNLPAIRYTLTDNFSTPQTAPIGATRNAEPGTGVGNIVDSNNRFSTSANKLVIGGGATALVIGDPGIWYGNMERVPGLSMMVVINMSNSLQQYWGWDNDATGALRAATGVSGGSFVAVDSANTGALLAAATSTDYSILTILRSNGTLHLIRVGTSGPWTLIWVGNRTNSTPLQPAVANRDGVSTVGNLRVFYMTAGRWADDYTLAVANKPVTVAADTIYMPADGLVYHTITAATGVSQELSVRYTDDNNRWIVRCDQVGSTIKLIERMGGTEVERSSASQTWTNATPYRIGVLCNGASIRTFVIGTAKNSYGSATSNQSATTAKVSVAGVDFNSWALTQNLPI